jgi:hypothetical protein
MMLLAFPFVVAQARFARLDLRPCIFSKNPACNKEYTKQSPLLKKGDFYYGFVFLGQTESGFIFL